MRKRVRRRNRTIKRKQFFDLAAGAFVRQRRNALLVGPTGVGKSHLCQAIGLTLVRAGFSVLYRSIFDAVRDLLHDEAFENHDKVMARYLKPDLLILDDMGIKKLPKRSGEFLFEIILRRRLGWTNICLRVFENGLRSTRRKRIRNQSPLWTGRF